MVDPARIKPPAPRVLSDRVVDVPPTVGEGDTSPPSPARKQRVDLKKGDFTLLILEHGKRVVWRKALLCSCLDDTTQQASLDCTDCDGSGYVYVDPHEIQAVMLNQDKRSKIYENFGMWVEGATTVTVEPQYRLGYRDSLELLDSVMSHAELVKKKNRRGIRSKLPSLHDSARYRIVNATKLMYRAAGTTSMVSLERDVHFTVSADGWVKWTTTGDALVPDGTYLSLHYDFHPVYLVVSHPHAMRDDVTREKTGDKDKVISLPINAAAKLDYLVDVNSPAPTTGG
jgi:hypothetical protein